ncbi:hypothetical protein KIPB_003116, partial [Kipferlia bialata]
YLRQELVRETETQEESEGEGEGDGDGEGEEPTSEASAASALSVAQRLLTAAETGLQRAEAERDARQQRVQSTLTAVTQTLGLTGRGGDGTSVPPSAVLRAFARRVLSGVESSEQGGEGEGETEGAAVVERVKADLAELRVLESNIMERGREREMLAKEKERLQRAYQKALRERETVQEGIAALGAADAGTASIDDRKAAYKTISADINRLESSISSAKTEIRGCARSVSYPVECASAYRPGRVPAAVEVHPPPDRVASGFVPLRVASLLYIEGGRAGEGERSLPPKAIAAALSAKALSTVVVSTAHTDSDYASGTNYGSGRGRGRGRGGQEEMAVVRLARHCKAPVWPLDVLKPRGSGSSVLGALMQRGERVHTGSGRVPRVAKADGLGCYTVTFNDSTSVQVVDLYDIIRVRLADPRQARTVLSRVFRGPSIVSQTAEDAGRLLSELDLASVTQAGEVFSGYSVQVGSPSKLSIGVVRLHHLYKSLATLSAECEGLSQQRGALQAGLRRERLVEREAALASSCDQLRLALQDLLIGEDTGAEGEGEGEAEGERLAANRTLVDGLKTALSAVSSLHALSPVQRDRDMVTAAEHRVALADVALQDELARRDARQARQAEREKGRDVYRATLAEQEGLLKEAVSAREAISTRIETHRRDIEHGTEVALGEATESLERLSASLLRERGRVEEQGTEEEDSDPEDETQSDASTPALTLEGVVLLLQRTLFPTPPGSARPSLHIPLLRDIVNPVAAEPSQRVTRLQRRLLSLLSPVIGRCYTQIVQQLPPPAAPGAGLYTRAPSHPPTLQGWWEQPSTDTKAVCSVTSDVLDCAVVAMEEGEEDREPLLQLVSRHSLLTSQLAEEGEGEGETSEEAQDDIVQLVETLNTRYIKLEQAEARLVDALQQLKERTAESIVTLASDVNTHLTDMFRLFVGPAFSATIGMDEIETGEDADGDGDEEANMVPVLKVLHDDSPVRLAELSGGQRSLAVLSLLLSTSMAVSDTGTLLLDEADAQLDATNRATFMRSVSEVFRNRQVIVVSHHLSSQILRLGKVTTLSLVDGETRTDGK